MGELIQVINFAFAIVGWCLVAVFAVFALISLGVHIWERSWEAAVGRHYERQRMAKIKQANPMGEEQGLSALASQASHLRAAALSLRIEAVEAGQFGDVCGHDKVMTAALAYERRAENIERQLASLRDADA